MKKYRLLIIIPNLMQGGAERIISFLALNLPKEKFDLKLIVIGRPEDSAFDFDSNNTVFLNELKVSKSLFKLIKEIYNFKPKVILSSMSDLNYLLGFVLLFFPFVKFIAREVTINSVNKDFVIEGKIKILLKRILERIYLFRVNSIICQSKDMLSEYIGKHNNYKKKFVLINNPITYKQDFKTRREKKNGPIRIITVGRLSKVKGHLRILKILSIFAKSNNFSYWIIGTGPEKLELELKVKELGLSKNIVFIDHLNDLTTTYMNSDLFIQGSFVEGFPNAILESVISHLPVLAFNVPGGTKEIIIEGVNGFLVDNEDSFIEKLHIIFNGHDFNFEISDNILYAKFNANKILMEYSNLISNNII